MGDGILSLFERVAILAAVATEPTRCDAALVLGCGARTLCGKLREYGVEARGEVSGPKDEDVLSLIDFLDLFLPVESEFLVTAREMALAPDAECPVAEKEAWVRCLHVSDLPVGATILRVESEQTGWTWMRIRGGIPDWVCLDSDDVGFVLPGWNRTTGPI